MKTARTGLALDFDLYQLAVKRADSEGLSFAAYVINLIAIDLIDDPDGAKVLSIQRARANRRRLGQDPSFSDGPQLKTDSEFVAEQKQNKARNRALFKSLGGAPQDPTLNEDQAAYDTEAKVGGLDRRSKARKTGT